MNPLFKMAVLAGAVPVIRFHIQRGFNVNARDRKGMSLLMYAAAQGHGEACRLLLEAGADPLLLDNKGQDALSFARSLRRAEAEAVLLKYLFRLPAVTQEQATEQENSFSTPETRTDGIRPGNEEPDFLAWEEEPDPTLPPEDPAYRSTAQELQHVLTRHIPIDTDAEDWSDIAIDLPEIPDSSSEKPTQEIGKWQAVRLLFLEGIRTGRLSRQQIHWLINDYGASDPAFMESLRIVLGISKSGSITGFSNLRNWRVSNF